MKIGLIGYGKMGQLIEQLAPSFEMETLVFNKYDSLTQEPDLYIDFSVGSAVLPHLEELVVLNRSVVIGTTGWESELSIAKKIVEESSIAALYAPNFSLGMVHFSALISTADRLLSGYDSIGIDTHHKGKKDCPSGTAKYLSSLYHIPFSSLRIGSALPKIEILFDGIDETITLTHQAKSRNAFARGALAVARWLYLQKGWKTLDEYLHSIDHPL